MAIAYLKSGKEARVLQGNPWVFRSDIDRVSGAWEPGDVVSVKSARGRMLGCALYNPQSQISLRFVTFRDERVNADFIRARIHRAVEYRRLFADMRSCRLVYAESDGLPALIVDSFGGVLSVQCLCLGMEKYKQTIIDALVDELHPDGIYERDDVPVRGYKEINLRAMKLLRDGGYLITCSCSQHILPQMFQGIVQSAAADTHTHLQQVEFRTQGRDHPILPALPETQYLKCGIYRVER